MTIGVHGLNTSVVCSTSSQSFLKLFRFAFLNVLLYIAHALLYLYQPTGRYVLLKSFQTSVLILTRFLFH